MRDRPIIYAGLLAFLLLAASPVWRGLAARTTARGPEIKLPRGKKECVRPTAYMRTSHMDLLFLWRDDVVRRADRGPQKSLTSGCLAACHGAKADFCDRCHNYAAVKPVCWDCHNDAPKLAEAAR
jgi:hypothetical protein